MMRPKKEVNMCNVTDKPFPHRSATNKPSSTQDPCHPSPHRCSASRPLSPPLLSPSVVPVETWKRSYEPNGPDSTLIEVHFSVSRPVPFHDAHLPLS